MRMTGSASSNASDEIECDDGFENDQLLNESELEGISLLPINNSSTVNNKGGKNKQSNLKNGGYKSDRRKDSLGRIMSTGGSGTGSIIVFLGSFLFHRCSVRMKIVGAVAISVIVMVSIIFFKDTKVKKPTIDSSKNKSDSLRWNINHTFLEGTSTLKLEQPLSFVDMRKQFDIARTELFNRLKVDYGDETFKKMFLHTTRTGRDVFVAPSELGNTDNEHRYNTNNNEGTNVRVSKSWEDATKKIIMKLIEVKLSQAKVPFVWATGGHSATAGHGNFYDESYTAYLEKALKPVMNAVGLSMTGRNYAMGGTNSAPELALCNKEIYGDDIDIIVWDFGMTDGRASEKMFLYFYRTLGYNKNRPFGIAYHTGGQTERDRTSVLKVLETELGLTIFQSSENVLNEVLKEIPDSFGKSDKEIKAMPKFVQALKCNGEIEKGEPYCGINKFNNTFCENRKYKTSWHPGWKWQAIMGNLGAIFVLELMDSALTILSDIKTDELTIFNSLRAEEEERYQRFYQQSKLPKSILKKFFLPTESIPDNILAAIMQGPLYCHTARLPSEIRYKGILPESSKTNDNATTFYDVGISFEVAMNAINDNKITRDESVMMPLVYDESERQDETCPITTVKDYKDFFLTSSDYSWTQLLLPTDSEQQFYGNNTSKITSIGLGIVGFCLKSCSWGKCPKGSLSREAFLSTNDPEQQRLVELKVNGELVRSLTKMHDCELLVNSFGSLLWKANKDNKFLIEAKVNDSNSYVRFSSWIVWTIPDSPKASDNDNKFDEEHVSDSSVSTSASISIESVDSFIASASKNFNEAKQRFIEQLKEQYGADTFERIFLDKTVDSFGTVYRGSKLLQQAEGGSSKSRFQRKAMIKVLQVLTQMTETKIPGTRVKLVPFVWATGGHSSAAGHGNLYEESYTAVLERSVKGILESIGINFVGRNYAMGGTLSAPELALCTHEVYGQDLDVIVWDFGMTDGNNYIYELLYFYRASLGTKKPACFSFHTDRSQERMKITKQLDNLGVTSLNFNDDVKNSALDEVPDSFGLTDAEIDAMPPFVQNFRCDGQIENGDPYCKEKKYNLTFCPKRKYMASWHQGWRYHALIGYLSTFFLIDVFEKALHELSSSSLGPADLLAQLQHEEDVDNEIIYKSSVPDSFGQYFRKSDKNDNSNVVYDLELFGKGATFCHTAKLPAEIRHKGILTESNKTGFTTFDKGWSITEANSIPNESEFIRLVYDEKERSDCPVTTIMDYKDFFYLNEREGMKKLILPNDSELREYGIPGQTLKGMIGICFVLCPWRQCEKGELRADDFYNGTFTLSVNDKPVTSFTNIHDCDLLAHDNEDEIARDPMPNASSLLWTPNNDGKFEISVQINKPNAYVRISAIIIW